MAKKTQNFYWEILSIEKAKEIFNKGKTKLYKIDDDDNEILVDCHFSLSRAITFKNELAIKKDI